MSLIDCEQQHGAGEADEPAGPTEPNSRHKAQARRCWFRATLLLESMPSSGVLLAFFGNDSEEHFHKNPWVGASCICLALPAPWIMHMGDSFTALFNLIMAICSIQADYFAIHSVWDHIDRLVACCYIIWLVILSLTWNGPLFTLTDLLLLVVLPFLYTRKSSSKSAWCFRHSLWHVIGGLNQFIILHRVYQQQQASYSS